MARDLEVRRTRRLRDGRQIVVVQRRNLRRLLAGAGIVAAGAAGAVAGYRIATEPLVRPQRSSSPRVMR